MGSIHIVTATDIRRTDKVTRTTPSFTRLTKLWAAGTGIALLLVASAYLVAHELADPLAVEGAGAVTLGNVTGFTIVGATLGAAIAIGIERFSRSPRLTFLAVTMIAVAGSAVVPFTATGSLETALWLNLFHLVVAVPVMRMLARWLPEDRAPVEA